MERVADRDAPEAEEMALIRRAAAGDHQAFGRIVVAYEVRLLAYLTHMLGDPEAARDVAQETFLAAYHALPRWRPPESRMSLPRGERDAPGGDAPGGRDQEARLLSPWLYRIATNRALSLIRTRSHEWRRSGADDPAHVAAEPADTGAPSLEERTAARDLLTRALRQLAAEDAACLVLHYVAGDRYGEIAERLGMTAEAVRKRVARGLAALRAAYAALDVEVRA